MTAHTVCLSQERAAKPLSFPLIMEANRSLWTAAHLNPELAGDGVFCSLEGGVLQTHHLWVAAVMQSPLQGSITPVVVPPRW